MEKSEILYYVYYGYGTAYCVCVECKEKTENVQIAKIPKYVEDEFECYYCSRGGILTIPQKFN
tara:strand:- start:552 stop:740 length:189 start_codon:yes stop_codon:yes gene_type:complete